MASILVPVAYLIVLVGALLVFSRIYRKRAATRLRYEPWFPSHPERNTYITLVQQSAPEIVLKAALLRRAVADVQRIFRVRDDKAALTALLQKGSIGDDLWTSFQAAEKEVEAEIIEVVAEANSFREGWGQIIFQTASEILQNERMKRVFHDIPKVKAEQDLKYGTKKQRAKAITPTPTPSVSLSTLPNGSVNGSPASKPNGLTPEPPSPARTASPLPPSDATTPTTMPNKSGKKAKKRK